MIRSREDLTTVIENEPALNFRTPTDDDDGKEIWHLIKNTGVLDLNSSYNYLMWAKYFDQTSVVVERNKKIVGFISGFIQPNKPDHLFIWQVAVYDSERKKGLALSMLKAILKRSTCKDVHYLEATVSPSNKASAALFKKLAVELKTNCQITECFTVNQFTVIEHEAENFFTIGPFQNA